MCVCFFFVLCNFIRHKSYTQFINIHTHTHRRFDEDDEEEEHGGFPALDHIRHFSAEEAELSDSDVTGFDSAHLSEAVKQPLYRKSKSQVTAPAVIITLHNCLFYSISEISHRQ